MDSFYLTNNMNVGLIQTIQESEHPAPPGHPENPIRLKAAMKVVMESDIAEGIVPLVPDTAEVGNAFRIHSDQYLKTVEDFSRHGGGFLDADTYVTRRSYQSAVMTARAAVWAVDTIMSGKYQRVILVGRPPGHHAEYDRAMGFCIINNVAVAAENLISRHKIERVAIIDWDVHHGNGTQHIFYERNDVFYFSIHQFPYYPGSGASAEKGVEKGEGYTINVPMPIGSDNKAYLDKFSTEIISRMDDYKPQFIIISAGFDGHRDDPLGGMNLTENGFGEMTRLLVQSAVKYCQGRLLSVVEGGYNPDANARSLYHHIKELQKD
jgi:acetoin utilization deacetylase AcuC-like enzyme